MLMMVMGLYRPGAMFNSPEASDKLNEDLTFPDIRLAGRLRDQDGVRGFAMVLEVESLERAHVYLRESSYFGADLFSEVRVHQYQLEVGRVS